MPKGHLRLISLHSMRHAIRGGSGLVFVLVTLVTGLCVAQAVIGPLELAQRGFGEMGLSGGETPEEIKEVGRAVVGWAIGESENPIALPGLKPSEERPWTTYLLDDHPALLSIIFLILIFTLPFLVPFGAFNQVSGDAQSRGLRYLLLRTERSSIFLGRFIGTTLFAVVVMGLLVATIALYLGLKVRIYDPGALTLWSLRGYLALAILTVPYVALCAWISACIDSPFGSLTISNLIVIGVLLFAAIGTISHESFRAVLFLLPWGLQNHLLHPSPLHFVGATLACAGYTAVFLYLGHRHFLRRDL
jgi:ABC-2 family transporter protein